MNRIEKKERFRGTEKRFLLLLLYSYNIVMYNSVFEFIL
mgnify:CR=1